MLLSMSSPIHIGARPAGRVPLATGIQPLTQHRSTSARRSLSTARALKRSDEPDPRVWGGLAEVSPSNEFTSSDLSADLQKWWDDLDKPRAAAIAAAAVAGITLSFSLVDGIHHLPPPLPRAFGFVGLVYSAWFTYRNVLFKADRTRFIDQLGRKADEASDQAEDASEFVKQQGRKVDEAAGEASKGVGNGNGAARLEAGAKEGAAQLARAAGLDREVEVGKSVGDSDPAMSGVDHLKLGGGAQLGGRPTVGVTRAQGEREREESGVAEKSPALVVPRRS